MPRYICCFVDEKNANKEYYLEWSTIVDAPLTEGMSYDDFLAYYQNRYGTEGMHYLPERMERVKTTGTSAREETLDELISFNRAGKNETCFTKEQIIEWYCRRGVEPEEEGTTPSEEEEDE